MSEMQTQTLLPTPAPARRRTSLWVWALLLVLAAGALVAAILWAGGPAAAEKLLGVENFKFPSFEMPTFGGGGSTSAPATLSTSTVSPDASPTTLPPDALERMYAEQIESRSAMAELVAGNLNSFQFGKPMVQETSASVPVTVTLVGNGKLSGTFYFVKYRDLWYFESLRDSEEPPDTDPHLATVDMDVAKTITQQQAEKGTQSLIAEGLLGGGFTQARVDGVERGPGTATIDLTLTGGSMPRSSGRIVCISKVDAGTTYWFVARFEKR